MITRNEAYRIERDRGSKESRQQLAVLREKWPLAFPVKHQDVRPLAVGIPSEIAAVNAPCCARLACMPGIRPPG
jgi:hypothetical protein